jgi:hypothetical protein
MSVSQALEKMQPNDMKKQGAAAKALAKALAATLFAVLAGPPIVRRISEL